jgi:hypothetical protein
VLSVPSSEPSSEVLPREQTLPLRRHTNRSKKKYRSWTLLDDNDVYHGNDDDKEECVGSKTMDVDDDEEEQKVDEEEEEQGGVDVLGTVELKRESKLALKDTDLCTYFFNLLERMSVGVI